MFDTDYEQFIHKSRYARWVDEKGRREDLEETVDRYFDYMESKVDVPASTSKMLRNSTMAFDAVPSMRAIMTAGPALERDNTAGFNCSFLTIEDLICFDEAMYILLCGTGVGFSVENQFISKLPPVPELQHDMNHTIMVQDSKEGWAYALRDLLTHIFDLGVIPNWNTSLVRPAGARLKTFGGRASGPEPLEDLLHFVVQICKDAQGRQLTDLECHDIMCKIGEVVVVGGVRRSAMISLSDLDSKAMANAKGFFPVTGLWMDHGSFKVRYIDADGSVKLREGVPLTQFEIDELDRTGKIGWWKVEGQRALSNNSAVYDDDVTVEQFSKEWAALIESKSGERGIFNRSAARAQVAKSGRRNPDVPFGTNPCGEIILRPFQFCNLTEVVVRASDDTGVLSRKVEVATILGTFQSTLTNFPYLRPIWKHNTEEERLLGVSMTGIMDNTTTSGQHGLDHLAKVLDVLREKAIEVNREWAARWGIPASVAITCVKPSGTVSQLVNSASGIHPRHSHYYIRSVRGDNKDPLTNFLKDHGIPHEPDVMKPKDTTVFFFPIKAPANSVTRDQLTALEHLEIWRVYRNHWCEHNPSVTINVRDEEWMKVGAWVFENLSSISGIALLPHTDHIYAQAPYQEVGQKEYQALLDRMPAKINWDDLTFYEFTDNTEGTQTLACVAGVCEI